MRTLAHISDLHFGKIDAAIVEALLAELVAAPPDLIIVSGDLTQRAKREQFVAARAFLDRLPSPCLVIPGNHDIPSYNLLERFTQPLRRYKKYISQDIAPVLVDDEVVVLGVNTSRRLLIRDWNWAHGSISREQIALVSDIFHRMPQRLFKILVTHHPFLPPPDAPNTPVLRRAVLALQACEAAGVDLLLAGHLHLGYVGDVTTHHSAIRRSILVAQAATATSTRLRQEPNAYNRIVVDGYDRVVIQARSWDGRAFITGQTCDYVRDGHHWLPHPAAVPGALPAAAVSA